MGRGGAYVSARVALQGRIHHPFPAHNACVFGMETPLRKRSGGHTGAAPTILQHTSPFRKGENKKFGARSSTARLKIKKMALAVELQAFGKRK